MSFRSSDKRVAHILFGWLAVTALLMQLNSNYVITFALATILFYRIDLMECLLFRKAKAIQI